MNPPAPCSPAVDAAERRTFSPTVSALSTARKVSPLYGDINRGPFWAVNVTPDDDNSSTAISLAEDQAIFTCLREGGAWFEDGNGASIGIGAGQMAIGRTGPARATLRRNGATDGIIIGFRRPIIRQSLEPHRAALHPALTALLFLEDVVGTPMTEVMSEHLRNRWIDEVRRPPTDGPAATFWHEGKIRELIALACFPPTSESSEFFCSRQKRLAAGRVERARAYLDSHFDEPLDLTQLAEQVGCSTHYLSRTFSEALGKTISQYLREIRIDRAARLIASGRCNVSEAAVEVGYQSLSHFSKAFLKEKGCLPSRFTVS